MIVVVHRGVGRQLTRAVAAAGEVGGDEALGAAAAVAVGGGRPAVRLGVGADPVGDQSAPTKAGDVQLRREGVQVHDAYVDLLALFDQLNDAAFA